MSEDVSVVEFVCERERERKREGEIYLYLSLSANVCIAKGLKLSTCERRQGLLVF